MKLLARISVAIAVLMFTLPVFAACPVALQLADGKLSGKVTVERLDAAQPPLPVNVPKAGCATLASDGTLVIEAKCFNDLFAGGALKVAAGKSTLEQKVSVSLGPTFKPAAGCAADGNAALELTFDITALPLRKLAYTPPSGSVNEPLPCEAGAVVVAASGGRFESVALDKSKKLDPRVLNAAARVSATGIKLERIELEEKASCGSGPPPGPPGKTVTYQFDPNWCSENLAGYKTVCVELSPRGRTLVQVPANGVVPPNQGVAVHVLHAPEANLMVTWGGTRGLTQPRVNTPAPARAQSGEEPAPPTATPTVVELRASTFTFAPRRAGTADLSVEAKTSEAEKQTFSVELEVDELTWGAVRFGFASVFGRAATRDYELRTFAGGTQTEIAVGDRQKVNFEAVLGFAPYVIDILAWGGRSHASVGRNAFVAPYLGFGIIGQGASGVESFGSIHLGLEFEVTRTFSVAGTAVWRRVTTLSDGYSVGSPVPAGTNFTTKSTGIGFGLVLNVSPDFLQFATPSSSQPGETATTVSAEAKE
jgi:hypothetical protein